MDELLIQYRQYASYAVNGMLAIHHTLHLSQLRTYLTLRRIHTICLLVDIES